MTKNAPKMPAEKPAGKIKSACLLGFWRVCWIGGGVGMVFAILVA